MKRILLSEPPDFFPDTIRKFVGKSNIFDSSCSTESRVYFIDKESGFYLKCSAPGSLKNEAEMTRFFHIKGLGTEVLDYRVSHGYDWLLTARINGEDCTNEMYLSEPKRLCDKIAEELRRLHETDFRGCPVPNRMKDYLAFADERYKSKTYDSTPFPNSFGYSSAEEAYTALEEGRGALKSEVLLHGDYCLPNIMLSGWQLSGFIDLGNGGVGDRHVDLFWGAWTLQYNLKTEKYRDRFFDAYGRDKIDPDILRTVAAAEVFG